jgi:hypothetical protein
LGFLAGMGWFLEGGFQAGELPWGKFGHLGGIYISGIELVQPGYRFF